MIITLTANTTMDQTVFVPALKKNSTIRATRTVHSMGGKPTDASWILGKMGITSLALGFKAGVIGEKIETMLHDYGVATDFVPVGGESRMNVVILDENDHSHTTITTSTIEVQPEHLNILRERYEMTLSTAACVVMGGTLPVAMSPTFYTEMIELANHYNVPTIFDANEPNLSAGLKGRPTYVKPNKDELAALTGKTIDSVETAYQVGKDILAEYGTCPIITLGEEGALAILQDRSYFIPPLEIEVVSPAGAGDAVLAGLASALLQGKPIEDGLKLGIATASAVVMQPGTAAYELEDMQRLLPQVELQPYK